MGSSVLNALNAITSIGAIQKNKILAEIHYAQVNTFLSTMAMEQEEKGKNFLMQEYGKLLKETLLMQEFHIRQSNAILLLQDGEMMQILLLQVFIASNLIVSQVNQSLPLILWFNHNSVLDLTIQITSVSQEDIVLVLSCSDNKCLTYQVISSFFQKNAWNFTWIIF